MSRFHRLSHAIWCCQYHIVWVPKYRFRILKNEVKAEVEECIRMFSEQLGCKIEELNVQEDHVHLLVMVPPKISLSSYVGTLKGRSAIRVFTKFSRLKHKPYWGNHFWARGYCVSTVGLDEEVIQDYIRGQEEADKKMDQLKIFE